MTKSHNLALLPTEQRNNIELSKRAALIAHQLRVNDIGRYDVKNAIDSTKEDDRETFRKMVNGYMGK